MESETRKESLSAMRVCRFCLTHQEPLSSLYEKSKTPKNYATLSMKILACIGIEVFPSDKMPHYICNRCTLFMEMSYGFKQVCRQADHSVLHFIQDGSLMEPITWPSLLNKVFRAHNKAQFGSVKTVTQDGATVKVTAEEISDIEEGDDDNVYSVKIGDGSEEGKSIKIITSSVDNQTSQKDRKGPEVDSEEETTVHSAVVKDGCYPCEDCDCTYPLEQLLQIHKVQKHRPRDVECTECGAKFFSKFDLQTHQVCHTSETPFECVVCDKKFKRLILLKRHEKVTHSDMAQLKCLKCPATFLSKIELEAHGVRHQSIQPFSCTLCGKRFCENHLLVKHIENIHKRPPLTCNYCPEQFSTMSKLGKHLRTHAGARSYPCKHCDKSFVKSHHYTRHLRVKHNNVIRTPSGTYTEAETWRCEECEEMFSTQDDLLFHSALHATASLTCPLCQEKFDDVDTVTAHIKSHANGAEFMCDYCELIFTSQQKLDTHMANSHESEFMDKETENEDEDSMDYDEGDDSIKVKEVDGQMVVEIKKAGDYMLPDTAQNEDEEEEEERNDALSEDSELDMADADGDTSVQTKAALPSKQDVVKTEVAGPVSKLNSSRNAQAVSSPTKPVAENIVTEGPSIVKKTEEAKPKVHQLPVSNNGNQKTIVKVETSSAGGTSDLSLRLLEKELQDLQRTSRNDVQKIKKHLHTSTPKPKERLVEKKETPQPKFAPEKTLQEKRPPGRPPKEKESKNAIIREEKDSKDKITTPVKEEKDKEKDTPKVVKNGASEKPAAAADEPVRRSNRPSKVKDYAKMIGDSGPESEEESSDEELEEEIEDENIFETPRRGRKPLPKMTPQKSPNAAVAPGTAPKKRGRPRKEPAVVPTKIAKKETSGDEEPAADIPDENEATPKQTEVKETKKVTVPASNILISSTGQTLKPVSIKTLPPGVKPLPLPRKINSGEVCEMQIGKKVVKVQKIVMTKAEADAMIKQGLVEMKDGTIVLKPGIKLPGTGSLKSQLLAEAESKKESPKNVKSLPTRCDFSE